MEKIAKQLTELIGHTPLLELSNYEKRMRWMRRLLQNWNILIHLEV